MSIHVSNAFSDCLREIDRLRHEDRERKEMEQDILRRETVEGDLALERVAARIERRRQRG